MELLYVDAVTGRSGDSSVSSGVFSGCVSVENLMSQVHALVLILPFYRSNFVTCAFTGIHVTCMHKDTTSHCCCCTFEATELSSPPTV